MLIGSECGLTAMVLVTMVVKAMVLTVAVTVTVPGGTVAVVGDDGVDAEGGDEVPTVAISG